MKRVKFSREALLSLDAILREMGITLHKDSNTNDEIDGTIIGYDGKAISIEEALSLFDSFPIADSGRWIDAREQCGSFVCSKCEYQSMAKYNYCPDCGAKMNGGAENGKTD